MGRYRPEREIGQRITSDDRNPLAVAVALVLQSSAATCSSQSVAFVSSFQPIEAPL